MALPELWQVEDSIWFRTKRWQAKQLAQTRQGCRQLQTGLMVDSRCEVIAAQGKCLHNAAQPDPN